MKEGKISGMLQKTKSINYTLKRIFKQKGSKGKSYKCIFVFFFFPKDNNCTYIITSLKLTLPMSFSDITGVKQYY